MNKEIFHFEELFRDVQLSNVFEDGKTFPDCIPNRPLEEINNDYLQTRSSTGFDLTAFIKSNFTAPRTYSSIFASDTNRSVAKHIELLWNDLTRKPSKKEGTLIPLPHPYIVPGGRFGEIYYWDSYFTMLGLRVSGKTEMIRDMIKNFSELIDAYGYIPNGNRTYFLGRSQPPFFSCMVTLLAESNKHALLDFLPHLEKEYDFWMRGSEHITKEMPAQHRVVLMNDGSILNRYWDNNNTPRPESFKEDVELSHRSKQNPADLFRNIRAAAESGWDFSTRWFQDVKSFESIHTTEIIPVDLNCLLWNLEMTLSEAWLLAGDFEKKNGYIKKSEERREALVKYCWNSGESFFFDYDFVLGRQKQSLTMAGAFPLYFKIATSEQAELVADTLRQKLLRPGGFVTTLENSGQQWDSPNGWAPLQWIAYQGLINYQLNNLAQDAKVRWLSLVESVYSKTGKMMEKYNVSDLTLVGGGGEYPNQDGFGWTNGVTAAMLNES